MNPPVLHNARRILTLFSHMLSLQICGCGSFTACPPHDFDVSALVIALPDEEAPPPNVHIRQPGDRWHYQIRRNQWDDGALFVIESIADVIVEAEPFVTPSGAEVISVRTDGTDFSCDGIYLFEQQDWDYLSQDETGRTSTHGFRRESEFDSESAFISKPAAGVVTVNPVYEIGAVQAVEYLYDNGTSVRNTATVAGVDRVDVLAGSFVAFRVEELFDVTFDSGLSIGNETSWVAPDLAVAVLYQSLRRVNREVGGVTVVEEVWELMSYTIGE